MRAMDVMTSEVIMVDENASVHSVAKLMAKHGISAVPVVDKEIDAVLRREKARAETMLKQ